MFTQTNQSKAGSSWLQFVLPEITTEQLKVILGSAPPGYDDEEKGYRYEYIFDAPDGGQVKLYDRWGVWRIGSDDTGRAEALKSWLEARIVGLGW